MPKIGEKMFDRVIPFARSIGATWYNADPHAPITMWMENNRQWINKAIDDREMIYDVGPSPGYPNYPGVSSKYYQRELDEIRARSYFPHIRVKIPGE